VALIVDRHRLAEPDQLARLAQLKLKLVAFASDPHVGLTQFAKQVQRRSSLLPQGHAQGVLLPAVLDGLLDLVGHAIEPVSRELPVDALVRPLVVVVGDPVVEPLAGIGERGEHSLVQELVPDGLPEPLDLA